MRPQGLVHRTWRSSASPLVLGYLANILPGGSFLSAGASVQDQFSFGALPWYLVLWILLTQ